MVKLVGMTFGRVVFCGNLLEYPVGRVLFYIKLVRNFDYGTARSSSLAASCMHNTNAL